MTNISIDDDVDFLTEQIRAVQELGQRDDVDDETIYDVSIRWGTALAGRLPRLVHFSSLGQLDEADERRFHALCDELRALSDLIDRFKLARPLCTDTVPDARRSANPMRRLLRRTAGNPSPPE
jgi:hypothetical protein